MSSTFTYTYVAQNTYVINYAMNYERFSLHSQDCLRINLTEDSAIYSLRVFSALLYRRFIRIEFRFEWPAFSFDERHWHLSSFVGGEADEEDLR